MVSGFGGGDHEREFLMRKVLAAVTLLLFALGVCVADEFGGKITSIEGNKITIQKKSKVKGEKGEEVTLTATDKVKVVKGSYNKETKKVEAGDAIEGGLKASDVKVGAFVSVVTDGDKVSEIRVMAGKKKKNNN